VCVGGESHQHERVAEKEITGDGKKDKGACVVWGCVYIYLIFTFFFFLFLLKLLEDYGGAPNQFLIIP